MVDWGSVPPPDDAGVDWASVPPPEGVSTPAAQDIPVAQVKESVSDTIKTAALEQAKSREAIGAGDRALAGIKVTPEGKKNFLKKRFDAVLDTAEGPLVYEKDSGWRFVDHPDWDAGQAASWVRAMAAPVVGPVVAGGDYMLTMHPETAGDIADLSGAALEALPDVAVAMLFRKLPGSWAAKLAGGATEGAVGGAVGGLLRQGVSSLVPGKEGYEGDFSLGHMALSGLMGALPGAAGGVLGKVAKQLRPAESMAARGMARELAAGAPEQAAEALARARAMEAEGLAPLNAGQAIADVGPEGLITGGNIPVPVGKGGNTARRIFAESAAAQAGSLKQFLRETANMSGDAADEFMEIFVKEATPSGEWTLSGMARALGDNIEQLAMLTGNNKEVMRRLKIGLEYAKRTQVPEAQLPAGYGLGEAISDLSLKAGKPVVKLGEVLTRRFRINDPVTMARVMTNKTTRDAFLSVLEAAKPKGGATSLRNALAHFADVYAKDEALGMMSGGSH